MQTLHHQKKLRAFVTQTQLKKESTHYEVHRDFPLCDAELGAPKIEWCKCYHLGCGKVFSNGSALVAHLNLQLSYNKGNIISHTTVYKDKFQQLSDECKVCKIKLNSKQQLINHLARLGIQGYWKKGETYQKEVLKLRSKGLSEKNLFYGTEDKHQNIQHYTIKQDLYETEFCLVCQEFPSNVLYQNCKHFNICYRCFKLLQDKQVCIYCKSKSPQLFEIPLPSQVKYPITQLKNLELELPPSSEIKNM